MQYPPMISLFAREVIQPLFLGHPDKRFNIAIRGEMKSKLSRIRDAGDGGDRLEGRPPQPKCNWRGCGTGKLCRRNDTDGRKAAIVAKT